MRINHNIASINTWGRLSANRSQASKSLEALSSGLRINKAGDDAAGLAISEKMRGQVRGLHQASRNAQDAISLIQTAEGGAASIHAMLQRSRELAVQAANGTLTDEDRGMIQAEISQIISQVDTVAQNTEFNTIKLLNKTGSGQSAFPGISQAELDDLTSKLPGWINDGLEAINTQLGIAYPVGQRPLTVNYYYDGVSTTAASMGTADNGTTLNLNVNLAQFFDGTGTLKPTGQLDTLIAHEMVHALEFTEMPFVFDGTQTLDEENWFIEGLAVAIQGGNGFLPSDGNINLINPFDGDYATSYQAVKVLHEITDGGIQAFIDRLEAGDTLDQAFNATTQNFAGTELVGAAGAANFTDVNGFVTWFNANSGAGVLNTYLTSSTDFTAGSGAIVQGGTKGSSGNLTLDQTIANGTGTATLTTYYSLSFANSANPSPGSNLTFAVGANAGQSLSFVSQNLTSTALGINSLNLSTAAAAGSSITFIDSAITKVSSARSYFGAMQNRLEHTISNLDSSAENLTASESRVRDVDMAKEMMSFTKLDILTQAAQAMLAQANQQPQGVLQLLR